MPRRATFAALTIASLGLGLSLAAPAVAQSQQTLRDPRAVSARNLLKPITVDLSEARIEDIMRFIEEVGNVDLEVMWRDSQFADGLDPEQTISVGVREAPLITLLERVLEKAQSDAFADNTWQFGELGQVQVGPKSRLNRFAFLKMYDINDIVFTIIDAQEAPQIDLNNVLNQATGGGGGGGSGSIFSGNEEVDVDRIPFEERVDAIVNLIQDFIEPDQWEALGGPARITPYGGSLLIRAPDYVHRQLEGYRFWPASPPASPASAGSR